MEAKVISIWGPDCCKPFWKLTTLSALLLAFPYLGSVFHHLPSPQKTSFKRISIILPSPRKSPTPFLPTYCIPSTSIHIQGFPVLKKKEEPRPTWHTWLEQRLT